MNENIRQLIQKIVIWAVKLLVIGVILYLSAYAAFALLLLGASFDVSFLLIGASMLLLPTLLIPLFLCRNKKKVLRNWGIFLGIFILALGINLGWNAYEESITINTNPNINVSEYLPFRADSKIVRLDREASLRFTEEDQLPIVDGAAAVFPVYSAFVNATYPEVELSILGTFRYNNTVYGYSDLAEKEIDIFFGAYPSQGQIDYALENETTFVYTPIGYEAFVFFVHKDNPVENLTTEQVQAIYAGEITNWSQVGGSNEPIVAYQRNEGSGSQSMLIRFMDGKELMDPPAEWQLDLMSGIVDIVSQYHSTSASIGFSYRYYVEGIIQNPDIKLLSIDGVAPTVENIQNGAYSVITPLYAVTWEGNENENVQRLLDWVLSEEGQYIIEQTGYVPIN